MNDELKPNDSVDRIRDELERRGSSKRGRYGRFTLSALASIPWVGGFLSAAADLDGEVEQGHINALQQQWLELHREKLEELGRALAEVAARLESLGDIAQERLEEEGYLTLVEQAFSVWDRAATDEKRSLVKRLLANAGGTRLCSDDVVRLFIEWIERYHEIHFAVMRAIYANPGLSRAEIWEEVSGLQVRDDSAEADLFKLMMRDLSTGGVVRQERPTTADGRYVRQRTRRPQGQFLVSPFDDKKPYVLTALGRQFLHYAMDDLAPRIGSDNQDQQP